MAEDLVIADQHPTCSPTSFLDQLQLHAVTIAETATERDELRRYPTAEYDELRTSGFWRLSVPTQYGGLGFGYSTLMAAVHIVAAADGSLGQLPQNHFNTVERVRLFGDDEQRERILSRVGSGAVLGNASAEPHDRPLGEGTTRLSRDGADYRLNGRKVYSTGALLADVIAVQARDETGAQLQVFVDRHAAGVTVADDWSGFGQRTTASGTTLFENVLVAAVDVIRTDPDPRPNYLASAQSQLLHCSIDTGISDGALRTAVDLSRSVHGGRGSGAAHFADDVLGVSKLGELWIGVETACALVRQSARRLDRLGPDSPLEQVLEAFYGVIAAKVVSTNTALSVTAALIDIGGASSTRRSLGLDRFWRDARTHTVHDAARWKPYSVGRRLLSGDVADAWSIGHPYIPSADLTRGVTRHE